jgi:succinate dehydrogenase / fumarate reductase membrane anchor subunit
MSLEADIAKVRGLGSAKEGTGHFWHQRLTAIALIPLSIWFVVNLVCVFDATYAEVTAWIQSPIVTTLLVALIGALLYHVKLGVQIVIEDYLHAEWLKLSSIICLDLGTVLCGLVSIVAILKISFGTN